MATYTVTSDPVSGIVTPRLQGFMSEEEILGFVRDLLRVSEEVRRRHGRMKLLFDNRDCAIFSAAALQLLGEGFKDSRQDLDRTAILVENALSRMQIKRSLDETKRVFACEREAIGWLESEVAVAAA